jgi:shikimate dehydrogenase
MAEAGPPGLRRRPSYRSFAFAADPRPLAARIRDLPAAMSASTWHRTASRRFSPALPAAVCRRQHHIPHKEAAFARFPIATRGEAIGAVNTSGSRWSNPRLGNTDAYGFAANLDEQASQWRQGDGPVCWVPAARPGPSCSPCVEAGSDIRLVNRNARAGRGAGRAASGRPSAAGVGRAGRPPGGRRAAGQHDLAGHGRDPVSGDLALGLDRRRDRDRHRLHAAGTPLLRRAAEAGLTTVDGLGMLLHQAVPGFERWFGVRPEVDAGPARIMIADMEAAA